jgi:hypothetical protein
LSIDLWHTTITAAIHIDGRTTPVAIDGASSYPTGVAVDPAGNLHTGPPALTYAHGQPDTYIPLPGQRLLDDRITIGTHQLDPIDVITTTLSTVVRSVHAITRRGIDEVIISVPAGWVTRQRRALQTAAHRAGLPTPTIVRGADSIARDQAHRGHTVPTGAVLAVCRCDTTTGEVVLLRHQPDGYDRLATIDLGQLGETPGPTLADQAATALATALDATGLHGTDLAAVYYQAPDHPALADTVTRSVDLAVTPRLVTDLSAALGAADPTPGPTAAAVRPLSWGLLQATISLLMAWSAAGMLTYQTLSSATVYIDPDGRPWLDIQLSAFALIPVFTTLGAVSAALLAAHTRTRIPSGRDPKLGSWLSLAAVLGAGVAAALSLITAQHFDTSPAPLLAWALIATTPLAGAVAGLGVVLTRTEPPRHVATGMQAPWQEQLAFPLPTLTLAALSTVAIVAATVNIPVTDKDLWWQLQHIGGYCLGWSIAFIPTINPWRRVIAGSLLAIAGAYTIGISTTGPITAILVAAITVWWIRRVVLGAGQLRASRQ